jgi:Predicted membrane protein
MARLARVPAPLTAAIAAYAAGFGALSILRDRAFSTGRFDLGNMVQAVWSTAHGDPLRVTNLAGEQVSRLGSHTDVVLALFAPLWWIWPSASMLLVVQAAAIALGALPVFWLARKHLGSERAGIGFALAYLLYPATTWLTLNEFHPVALATPALLYAFWYLDEDRIVPFAVFASIAAASKEEVALVIAGYGVWYALAQGRRTAGTAIASVSLCWSAVAIAVVIPHFNGGHSAFEGRYSEVGGSPGGILHTAFHDPTLLFNVALDHAGAHYLLDLVLPLAGLCLLSPIALAALPELAVNLLSSAPTQTSIHFHYTAAEIPPLVIAAVFGAARVGPRWRIPVATIVLLSALVGNYRLGAIPFWRELPGGQTLQATAGTVTEHDWIAARALQLIPGNAVVSATNSLGAHLSARRRILSFPYVQDATWIAADETQPGYADRVAPLPAIAQLVWLRRNPAWRLVFEQDGVLVFRRVLPP